MSRLFSVRPTRLRESHVLSREKGKTHARDKNTAGRCEVVRINRTPLEAQKMREKECEGVST